MLNNRNFLIGAEVISKSTLLIQKTFFKYQTNKDILANE